MNVAYRTTLNYGTRLYQKGLQKLEDVERRHQEALALKEQDELKDHTFHPKINPVSNLYGTKGAIRPEDNLIQKGMLVQDKLEQKRAEAIYETQKSHSFHPHINDNSRKMADQRSQFFSEEYVGDETANNLSRRPDQFLHLYEDAMKRVERHNKIYSM